MTPEQADYFARLQSAYPRWKFSHRDGPPEEFSASRGGTELVAPSVSGLARLLAQRRVP